MLPGIAIWKRPFALQIAQDVTVRYKILKFYYQQYLITYAIPVSKADFLTSLPQIECTPDEIKAILRAADVLSKPSLKEKPHRISSPVANDIAAHHDAFASHSTADLPARLLTLMQSDDYILALIAICADVHYRTMHSQPTTDHTGKRSQRPQTLAQRDAKSPSPDLNCNRLPALVIDRMLE